MLGVLSAVVGLLVLLWLFYDFIWPPPPSVDRQLGKPDQPIEYNLRHNVSYQRISKQCVASILNILEGYQGSLGYKFHFLKFRGGGGGFKKVLYREVLPRGPNPYPFVLSVRDIFLKAILNI